MYRSVKREVLVGNLSESKPYRLFNFTRKWRFIYQSTYTIKSTIIFVGRNVRTIVAIAEISIGPIEWSKWLNRLIYCIKAARYLARCDILE